MPSAESRALSAGLQMYSPSALQLGQYISRDASKVVASASSIPTISASFRAMGSYSSAVQVRSKGTSTRSRGAAGQCFLVE